MIEDARLSDDSLIDGALEGNSEAFGLLVRKYQDRLFNTLTHMIGCREEAEDVAQDAFIQAFVKLNTFHRTSAFYTWLYRIAFNVAISRRRKRRREVSLDQTREATGLEPIDISEAPDQQLDRQQRAAQLHAGLATLSDEHRAILVLREMDGRAYEEIAEILELPVGTVRSRLHRARLQLQETLKDALKEEEEVFKEPAPKF